MGYFIPILLFGIIAFANGMFDAITCSYDAEFIRQITEEFSKERVHDLLNDAESPSDATFSNTDKDMNFIVYKRHDVDNPYRLKFNNAVNPDCVKKEWTTIIFIHGWRPGEIFLDSLKRAYWAEDANDINVIEVDWTKAANNMAYCPCAKRVPSVGETIAKFIEFNRKQIDLDKLIIVGHSLGSHCAGFAGKYLQQNFGLIANQIVGLDPAGFRFRHHKRKLQPDDAREVIVIHTTSTAGHLEPLGTLDIYINGGKKQPDFGLTQGHTFAKIFYENLFKKVGPIVGRPYPSYEDVKDGKIPRTAEIKVFGGEPVPPNGTLLYVTTKDQPHLSPINSLDPSEMPTCSGCLAFRLRPKKSPKPKKSRLRRQCCLRTEGSSH